VVFWDNGKFFMRDLGIGYGLFIKISESLILENDQLINIGESYILMSIIQQA
jgi:hypothetical protein